VRPQLAVSRMSSFRKLVICFVALGAAGVVGFFALAWRPAMAPILASAPQTFAPELIAKGEALAGGGYCAECHTAKGGKVFAGGYPMQTPFGVLYSTNITPDPETGIGLWSEAAFARAMHEGVARDGSHLFPGFPYDHFTKLSDDDVRALYAYFMTRPSVRAPALANTIPFPFGIRAFQAGWKLLFFRSGRFEPVAGKSEEWNRGAYLALGLSHCGACHTPRNLLGAEKAGDAYAGAVVDNWTAPPLTEANPVPGPWTQEELHSYLRNGVSVLHGSAAGPMSPVVQGLSALPESDVQALAVYFADIDHAVDRPLSANSAVARAMSYARIGTSQEFDADARLYTAACASCHYNAGHAPLAVRPELALNSALNLPDPTNLIQVVLRGVSAEEGIPGVVMPSFERALSDTDIARIASYLRRTRTNLPPWPDLDAKVTAMRRQIRASQ
jgi:mono/diheme cytochrome c family protein